MRSMIKRHLCLLLLLGYLQSCEEVYKEEQFNVIVPVMVQQKNEPTSPATQEQIVQKNDTTQEKEKLDAVSDKQVAKEKNIKQNTAAEAENLEKQDVSEKMQTEQEEQSVDEQQLKPDNKNELSSAFTQKTVESDEIPESEKTTVEVSPTPKPTTSNSIDKALDPREKARRQWLDLKNFASRRGFSQEDVNNLIPESLSIENYIKFGDIEKTNEKLVAIEAKLKDVRVSRGYVKQKYRKISQKVATSQLPIDEKNDFNIRLKQAEKAIEENGFNSANRELNELEVDLGQVQTLDQVFEN